MISRMYLAALFTCIVSSVQVKIDIKKNENACKKFAANAYFDTKLVLGPPWRIYYAWNSLLYTNCLALQFFSVNPWLVHTFYKSMGEYMIQQPAWKSAVLYVTIGAAKEELLLIPIKGPAGKFHGVFNFLMNPTFRIHKKKKSIPVLTFQMKLLQGGRYLVIMDCESGTVSLGARYLEEPPSRFEIESVAKTLDFGNGALKCRTTSNNSESLLLEPPNYDIK